MSQSATLILVEDDTRLRHLVTEYLEQSGFTVIALADGKTLQQTVSASPPDVIVLDIMLPGEDGLSLCQQLRKHYQGPLLFMTAKNDAVDEILGLELGADDYVSKPVEPRLLLARIQALLRRTRQRQSALNASLRFGNLYIDKEARSVTLGDENISLTSHEFDLLYMLAENAGCVVHREHIYRDIIGREYDGLDRSADVRISRLRKKLNDNTQQPYRIKTIWGKGFFFVADAWQ
ncbi:response regulator [Alteromonas halophila]|uniref:DNA-binding response regulator n=1 Tax=Alteromonas halophila TaxID=516698 RepID=A0A918JJA3_9ALTE|nr:response regulator [Alteromonas halophila]GGW81393.1 DNA-binding response regulator [Alteromonas halophila]